MNLFKSKAEKELDAIINRLKMNMSNNYKDNAQANLKEFEAALEVMRNTGMVKTATLSKYEQTLEEYKVKIRLRQGEILAAYFVGNFSEYFDNLLETIRECE